MIDIDKECGDHDAEYVADLHFMRKTNIARGIPLDRISDVTMYQLWKSARATIPPAPAEHQQRAKDQHAHDIGMAHIICDHAGIPPGEIIARLVALSGKGDAN